MDNFENVPDKDEKISEPSDDENNGCIYILEIDSTIGCPLQCDIVDGKLCSGNGLCQYDETNLSPKCFCYENWFGDDCSLDSPTNVEIQHDDTKDIILLIFIVVVLTVLVVIIIYLSYNIYAVKMNTTIGISDEEIVIDANNNNNNNDDNNSKNKDNNSNVTNIDKNKKQDKKVKKLKSQLAPQRLLLNEDNDDHPIVV